MSSPFSERGDIVSGELRVQKKKTFPKKMKKPGEEGQVRARKVACSLKEGMRVKRPQKKTSPRRRPKEGEEETGQKRNPRLGNGVRTKKKTPENTFSQSPNGLGGGSGKGWRVKKDQKRPLGNR